MQSPNQHVTFNIIIESDQGTIKANLSHDTDVQSGSDEGGDFQQGSNELFKLYLLSKNISLNILQLENLIVGILYSAPC